MESLRPPFDYRLDHCIGTTYSLDLLSLLTVPLSFTFFDFEERDGKPCVQPIALLEAVRQYADKITIFCQAGKTYAPKTHQLLDCFLEGSVRMVKADSPEGVFHPKVWILRFVGDNKPVKYRILCLSRNLTFDRSWDTILSLDGEVVDRQNAFSANHPLGNFIKALPSLEIYRTPNDVKKKIDNIQKEIRFVEFTPPEGFENTITFHPIGIEGYRRFHFPDRNDRMLIISPFVSDGKLRDFIEMTDRIYLLSRTESLDECIPQTLKKMKKLYVLDPSAEPEEEEGSDEDSVELQGLHAKTYVIEQGSYSQVYSGSANATNAAFGSNVEFLVGLTGRTRFVGIDSILDRVKGQTNLRDLLKDYDILESPVSKDCQEKDLEKIVDQVWRNVIDSEPIIMIEQKEEGLTYSLTLQSKKPLKLDSPGLSLKLRPMSLMETHALDIRPCPKIDVTFETISFEALTSFIVFEATIKKKLKSVRKQFVLNLPTSGMPEDRRARVMRSLLKDKDNVLRLIMMILDSGDPTITRGQALSIRSLFTQNGQRSLFSERTLFESLLRVLSKDPARIDQVQQIVDELRKNPEGTSLLPERFDEIWNPIIEARRMQKI
jgi:hypothetical protein